MRTLGDLHDGPTDLRTPGALVRSVQRSHQIVLPQGPVRGKLITRHVGGQGSIGQVNISMQPCVDDSCNLDVRRVVGPDPTDTFDGPITGNVDRCRASPKRARPPGRRPVCSGWRASSATLPTRPTATPRRALRRRAHQWQRPASGRCGDEKWSRGPQAARVDCAALTQRFEFVPGHFQVASSARP